MKLHHIVLALLLSLSLPCFAAAPSSAVTEAAAQSEATATRFQNYIAQFRATFAAPAHQFALSYAESLTSRQVRNSPELLAFGESVNRLARLYPPLYGAHQKYMLARDAYAADANAETAAALAATCVDLNSRLADAEAALADIATQAEAIYARYGNSN